MYENRALIAATILTYTPDKKKCNHEDLDSVFTLCCLVRHTLVGQRLSSGARGTSLEYVKCIQKVYQVLL